eukprot:3938321-Rhodomonas_salina.2
MASTAELDAAVATVKEFGMCLVAGNDEVPPKTFIARNDKGVDHRWDICTDGAMLLQVHNNDPSRIYVTRVYISKRGDGDYEVHVVLKNTEVLRRVGFVVNHVASMQQVNKLLATVQCSGPHSAATPLLALDPAKLANYFAVKAGNSVLGEVAKRTVMQEQMAEEVEAEGRARRDEEVMAARSK